MERTRSWATMNSAVWILPQAASGWNSFDQMLMQVAYGKKKDCSVNSDVSFFPCIFLFLFLTREKLKRIACGFYESICL